MARARDVQRRVADDEHFVTAQLFAEQRFAAPLRNGGDLVAFHRVVREGACLKLFPQAEAPQLDLRAKPNIAREQADHGRLRQGAQIVQPVPDTGMHSAR
jgi:hypothetical protein